MAHAVDCLHETLLRLWRSHERLAKSRHSLDSAARLMRQSAVLVERTQPGNNNCAEPPQAERPG